MHKSLILVDGSSLIFRAFYGLSREMTTIDGTPTKAIYGFFSMIDKILSDFNPEYFAVCFDLKTDTFRKDLYKKYKANRNKMPEDLGIQIPYIKEILDLRGIKRFELEKYEADDLLGTLSKKFSDKNPLIITGDKDLLQLVDEKINVLITKKGLSEYRIFDPKEMDEEYGFSKESFIDYKALRGDSSDNIPGLPGVGEKTAIDLIKQFKSIENIRKNISEIKREKLRDIIKNNSEILDLSKKLSIIIKDAPIETKIDELKITGEQTDELFSLYKKLELNKFAKNLEKQIEKTSEKSNGKISDKTDEKTDDKTDDKTDVKIEGKNGGQNLITDSDKTTDKKSGKKLKKNNAERDLFATGNEKDITEDNEENNNGGNTEGNANTNEWTQNIKNQNSNNSQEISNKDLIFEAENGFLGLFLKNKIVDTLKNNINQKIKINFDLNLAAYLLNSSRSNYSLDDLCLKYDVKNNNIKNDDDTKKILLAIKKKLEEELKKKDLLNIYYDIEIPILNVISRYEALGIKVSKTELSEQGKKLDEMINALSIEIKKLAKCDFNINSPKQLAKVLFEDLKLKPTKKIKTGYSTNNEVLDNLIDEHKIIGLILEFRKITKIKNTYIDGIIPLINNESEIHAKFEQTTTVTGRISSKEPNMQNLPTKSAIGKEIRKAFIPRDDNIFVSADYSQIELRVLAHLSEDKNLINNFNNGLDIHLETAKRFFNIDESVEKVSDELRRKAKAINFGVIYGISPFSLAKDIGESTQDAKNYIEEYFRIYSNVRSYFDKVIMNAKTLGYTKTIFNRRRYINELKSKNKIIYKLGERFALNSPIQGSAADIIKLAMININKRIEKENLVDKIFQILQIHDEIILETKNETIDIAKKIIKEEMESAYKLKVPLIANVSTGKNLFDLK